MELLPELRMLPEGVELLPEGMELLRVLLPNLVLVGAAAGQTTVLVMYAVSSLGFLWYNLVASVVVVAVAWLVSFVKPNTANQASTE